ncbi:MAG: Asp-tRNA(Asn)/Glu-tRNA(Gln) amidotransferase subunit GatC [Pseudobdellovibrionaceae bacterium]
MDLQTVKKVARLARISLTDEQEEQLVPQLSKIMGFIEQLGEVNTDNVAPLASVVENKLRLRADEITDGDNQSGVLKNAPESAEGYFVTTKVVE